MLLKQGVEDTRFVLPTLHLTHLLMYFKANEENTVYINSLATLN